MDDKKIKTIGQVIGSTHTVAISLENSSKEKFSMSSRFAKKTFEGQLLLYPYLTNVEKILVQKRKTK